jgi:alkylation response protein AidB-like acyl-CoA dehydrogenase
VTSLLSRELCTRAADAERWAGAAFAHRNHATGFDATAWRALADAGLFRIALPTNRGGEGQGAVAITTMLEALGRGGADRGLLMACGAHVFGCAVPIAAYATPAQAERWLPALASGDAIGGLAVTEPGGGSTFERMATVTAATDKSMILSGRKTLVCNAPISRLLVVLARQFPERGALGLTAFLVPRETSGVHIEPIAGTSGLHGASLGEVVLDGCVLSEEAVLGRPGAGLRVFMSAMKWERCGLLAGFLGAAERDLLRTAEILAERGGNLLKHQAVAHKLARIKVRLATARAMLRQAAESIDAGNDDQVLSAMAKLVISESLVECAEDTARLLAGAGWAGIPFDPGAALADTLGGLFASGTSEVLLDLIGRSVMAGAPP